MKATGIVRRIDDLGRVVIPKEIRRTMRIREGDPLEIYTNPDGEVIFKKYSAINEMSEGAAEPLRAVEGITTHALTIAPILTNGDITGAVAFMATDDTELCTDKQSMLAKAAAMFLGKQIEE